MNMAIAHFYIVIRRLAMQNKITGGTCDDILNKASGK